MIEKKFEEMIFEPIVFWNYRNSGRNITLLQKGFTPLPVEKEE